MDGMIWVPRQTLGELADALEMGKPVRVPKSEVPLLLEYVKEWLGFEVSTKENEGKVIIEKI